MDEGGRGERATEGTAWAGGVSRQSEGSEHPSSLSPTSQHQQQVLQAMERAKQVTVGELNSLIGVSHPGPCPVLGRPCPRPLHQEVLKLGVLCGQLVLVDLVPHLRPLGPGVFLGTRTPHLPLAHPSSSLAAAAPATVPPHPPCAPHSSPIGAGGWQCHGAAGPVRSSGCPGSAGRGYQG